MSWIKDYAVNQLKAQIIDMSGVKADYNFIPKTGKFYINSQAGLITYKIKKEQDIARFRDKWVNRVELLKIREQQGENIRQEIFFLYEEILSSEKVSYTANVHTRIKNKLWKLKKFALEIF